MSFIDWLSLVILLYWLIMFAEYFKAKKYVIQGLPPSTLTGSTGPSKEKLPLVSVIVAACEEESTIYETVQHLLKQTYQRLEVIAVNDRSHDRTGVKLEQLRRWSQNRSEITVPLTVVHITALPSGWLGKNHALYQGYLQSKGQVLLFTDADVRFAPDTIERAVGFMRKERADHLTLSPSMVSKNSLLRGFVHFFMFSLNLFVGMWKANVDGQSKKGMGIGAFNMLTRGAYEAIGTHKAFALRPDDDLQLGIRVKRSHLVQRLVVGKKHLEVEWYTGLKQAFHGLEKNVFSGFHYSVPFALLGIAGQLALFLFPFIGVLLGGWSSAVYLLSLAILIFLYVSSTRSMTVYSGIDVLLLPVSIVLLVTAVARSVFLNLKQGGIHWRGTFYSLKELKQFGKGE